MEHRARHFGCLPSPASVADRGGNTGIREPRCRLDTLDVAHDPANKIIFKNPSDSTSALVNASVQLKTWGGSIYWMINCECLDDSITVGYDSVMSQRTNLRAPPTGLATELARVMACWWSLGDDIRLLKWRTRGEGFWTRQRDRIAWFISLFCQSERRAVARQAAEMIRTTPKDGKGLMGALRTADRALAPIQRKPEPQILECMEAVNDACETMQIPIGDAMTMLVLLSAMNHAEYKVKRSEYAPRP